MLICTKIVSVLVRKQAFADLRVVEIPIEDAICRLREGAATCRPTFALPFRYPTTRVRAESPTLMHTPILLERV